MTRALLFLAVLALSACPKPVDTADAGDPSVVPPVDGTGPIACDATSDAGARFVDSTVAWNLGDGGLNVTGNRLTVADLDGDGYPDLVVHAVSSNARELLDGGKKLVWQLMNRPRADGKGRQFVDATDNGFFQVRGGSTTARRSAQLAVFADVDDDGDLDGFSGTYTDPTKPATDPGDRSEILLNDGTGHFTLAPPSDPHPGDADLWPTTSAAFTDVDRDGHLDLFVGAWYQAYGQSYLGTQANLFLGRGDGTFITGTGSANLTTQDYGFEEGLNHRPAYGVTACDLNDDGAPELMVSAYGRQWNLLYRNLGAGRFVEVGQDAGYAADSNVDFRDNQFFLCWCTKHASDAACTGAAQPAVQCPNPADSAWDPSTDTLPWRNGGNTFATACADVDGDGKNDLYSAEIHHWWAGKSGDSSELLMNVSRGDHLAFQRLSNETSGMVWPHPTSDWNEGGLMVAPGDLDNDGRLDLVVAASDYPDQFGLVFRQRPDGKFEEVGKPWGIEHACLSGLAIADFDRDGDLDVIAGSGTARDCSRVWKKNEVHLYENQGGNGKSLLLKLSGDGVTANRSAVGAKVTVTANGHTQTREVGGGYGHFGMQNDLWVHVGLGGCGAADSVSVRWPDAQATTQTWARVPAGVPLLLKQGDGRLYKAMP